MQPEGEKAANTSNQVWTATSSTMNAVELHVSVHTDDGETLIVLCTSHRKAIIQREDNDDDNGRHSLLRRS
jgi:hypothetical protein